MSLEAQTKYSLKRRKCGHLCYCWTTRKSQSINRSINRRFSKWPKWYATARTTKSIKMFSCVLSQAAFLLHTISPLSEFTIEYYTFTIICDNDLIPLRFLQKTTIWSGRIFFIGCYLFTSCLYCVIGFYFTISMYLLRTFHPMFHLYVCWCHELRLSDLNKETTYLLNLHYFRRLKLENEIQEDFMRMGDLGCSPVT